MPEQSLATWLSRSTDKTPLKMIFSPSWNIRCLKREIHGMQSAHPISMLYQCGGKRARLLQVKLHNCPLPCFGNIVSVTGRGYQTPDEAYRNRAVNMGVNILVWNDNGMTDITFDGQWYLSVSAHSISLPRTAESDVTSLSVLTDFNPFGSSTKGWYVKSITDSATHINPAPWLKVSPMSGAPNELKNVEIQTLSDNNTGKDRVATIVFAAGRLEYPVTIRQTLIDRPTITFNYWMPGATYPVGAVIPGELVFSFSDPNSAAVPQGFRVAVTPGTITFIAYRTDVPGYKYVAFDFAPPVTSVISTDPNGYFYTVASPPKVTMADITSGSYIREEQLVFQVTNGPYTVKKNLLLKHVYIP